MNLKSQMEIKVRCRSHRIAGVQTRQLPLKTGQVLSLSMRDSIDAAKRTPDPNVSTKACLPSSNTSVKQFAMPHTDCLKIKLASSQHRVG